MKVIGMYTYIGRDNLNVNQKEMQEIFNLFEKGLIGILLNLITNFNQTQEKLEDAFFTYKKISNCVYVSDDYCQETFRDFGKNPYGNVKAVDFPIIELNKPDSV